MLWFRSFIICFLSMPVLPMCSVSSLKSLICNISPIPAVGRRLLSQTVRCSVSLPYPVINSTAYGRITLFRNRLIAGSIAASAGAVLLAAGNHALSILISGRLPQPDGWNHAWFRSTAIVLIGTIGFFLFAAFVCDSLKNQPAAMCICGVPFAFSYFINVAVLKKFEFFWFVRYGFFAEWMRGRRIGVTPEVWGVWYALLLGGLLLAAIHQRKERKEL